MFGLKYKNQMELVLLRFSSASMIALRVRGNWNVCCSIISKFWPLTISLSLSFSLYLSFSIFLYLSLYIYLFFLSVFSSNILIFDYHSVLVFQINWPIIDQLFRLIEYFWICQSQLCSKTIKQAATGNIFFILIKRRTDVIMFNLLNWD